MKMSHLSKTAGTAFSGLGMLTMLSAAQAQSVYTPASWVNDPYSPNANYSLTGGNTTSPVYTDNGTATGSLWGYSPIGSTLSLVNPGDNLTLTGEFSLAGNVNNSNLQFRLGLLDQGSQSTDTGWLGYLIALPNVAGGPGLYERNNPNTGVFGSGTGSTTISAGNTGFAGSVVAGSYDVSLSITLDSATSETIAWNVAGINGNTYSYTGSYLNSSLSTLGSANFDTVGFLAGGSTFTSASASDSVTLSDLQVTYTPVPEPTTLGLLSLGVLGLMLRRRA